MSSKKKEYDPDELALADIFKAFSHPARLAILKELAKRQSCICGEIVDVLPLSQSTVSQHLKELKSARLIKGNVDGPKSCYCINYSEFELAVAKIDKFFTQILNSKVDNECCGLINSKFKVQNSKLGDQNLLSA
jgi:ArsR family transcriptional regulator, arsenate/arsenite/antimonite-responsive transcriptional repressor